MKEKLKVLINLDGQFECISCGATFESEKELCNHLNTWTDNEGTEE